MLCSLLRCGNSVAGREGTRLGLCASRRSLSNLARAKDLWGARLVVTPEVEHALETSQPIIALETAIVTHGMPHPTNLQTASSLESIIRSRSAVPATVALIDGIVHVGLSEDQLAQLADPESDLAQGAVKVSRRDLGPALAFRRTGGTTVAGTMYIASTVGIKVFVTGGIGGVHRGAESSMDISADLIELGRTPMAVVCAGAKSILDIPRTLEVLETQGVCVATYGATRDFPAFYHPSSGCKSPWTVPNTKAAANLIHTSLSLPTSLSTLLAVPIPAEHTEAGAAVQQSVEQAVRESVEQGIDKRGKEVTPWLLKRVGELTKGRALNLNVKLIENNARVGADVAVKVAELFRASHEDKHASSVAYHFPQARTSLAPATPASRTKSMMASATASLTSLPQDQLTSFSSSRSLIDHASSPEPSVLVFGSAAIDLTSTSPYPLAPGTTTPGTVFVSPGGVGRNIAEAAQNLLPAGSVRLISPYGTVASSSSSPSSTSSSVSVSGRLEKPLLASSTQTEPDAFGKLLMLELGSCGLRTDGLVPSAPEEGRSTAVCSLTLEKDGDLVAGVADMSIVEILSAQVVEEALGRQSSSPPNMVVFDCNLLEASIETLLKTCQTRGIPTFCDPTSTPKLPRLIPSLISLLPASPPSSRPLTHLSPNILELNLLHTLISSSISDTHTDSATNPEQLSWEYINSLSLGSQWRAAVERFTSSPRAESLSSGEAVGQGGREWISKEGVIQKMIRLLPFIENFWLKAGSRGLLHLRTTATAPPSSLSLSPSPSLLSSSSSADHQKRTYTQSPESISQKLDGPHRGKYLVLTHYPAPQIDHSEIISTTGAGDTLVGGLVAGLVGEAEREERSWVCVALDRVGRSLRSRRAVG